MFKTNTSTLFTELQLVLGPLLFLLYINDIADNLESLARLFADDTSLAYSSANLPDIEETINNDLSKLNDWSKIWLTTFNPNKTKLMFISNTGNSDNLSVMFDDVLLDPVNTHRHLGVVLSNNAKWNAHIDSIYTSCMKKVNVMRTLKYKLNKKNPIKNLQVFHLTSLRIRV